MVSFRLPADLKTRAEQVAKRDGYSLTKLTEKALELITSFDPHFRNALRGFSEDTQIPQYIILQNLFITWLADRSAFQEAYGGDPRVLDEFIATNRGFITGDRLFRDVYSNRLSHYQQHEEERLLGVRADGIELSPEEAAWLEERLAGRTKPGKKE